MTGRSNRSAELVIQLRDRFLCEYEAHKYDDIYDENDLPKILEDDWFLKRFILAKNRDMDAAFEMLNETMKWRLDFFVSDMRDFHFPVEFYKIGALFPYEPDKEGHVVLYMRICCHQKITELEEPTRGFLVHMFNKAEKLARGQGFAIVFDLTGAGYYNLDWEFLRFLVTFGRNHFPGSLAYVLVYNLPWILNAMQKIAFSMLSQELIGLIRFGSGDDIFKYIDKENVPDYLGGTCTRNFRAVAPGSSPIQNLVLDYGYSMDDYNRIYPKFKKYLDESDKAIATKHYVDPVGYFDDITGVEITPLPLPSKRIRRPKLRPELVSVPTSAQFVAQKLGPLLEIYPSNQVTFIYDHAVCAFIGEVIMRNVTSSPVAFKVQSTNPRNYAVAPRLGIILPNASLRLTIQMVANDETRTLKDKFLVVALPVSETNMNAHDFSRLWMEKKDSVASYKLTCHVDSESYNNGTCSEEEGSNEVDIDIQVKQLSRKYDKLLRAYNRTIVYLNVLVLFVFILFLWVSCESIAGVKPFELISRGISTEKMRFLRNSVGISKK